MKSPQIKVASALVLSALSALAAASCGNMDPTETATTASGEQNELDRPARNIQVGTRPYYLVENMDEGPLKQKLQRCSEQTFQKTEFSIAHRGAGLEFPEHTKEGYEAAARMGAGIIECDVTFTKDRELVCRHSQCDLATTTNILAVPALAAKCTKPFVPADATAGTDASATCCTSDITLAEFKSLCGKMDGFNPKGTTVEQYMAGTPTFRTDLYSTCGTLMSHKEYIATIDKLGTKFTPELKAASVEMPYEGTYTQEMYAQQMIDEYKAARISPRRVFAQSFNIADIRYWLKNENAFGQQAVYLDDRVDAAGGYDTAVASLAGLAAEGVKIVAPPMWALVTLDANSKIIPSSYATTAKANGLDIITWTFERSGLLKTGGGGYYYSNVASVINNDGDAYNVLDVLGRQVKIRGIFSDWPGSVTYYANCMNL